MFVIPPDVMLFVGALSGFVGFTNILILFGALVWGLLNPPTYNRTKIRKHSEKEWPTTDTEI